MLPTDGCYYQILELRNYKTFKDSEILKKFSKLEYSGEDTNSSENSNGIEGSLNRIERELELYRVRARIKSNEYSNYVE